MENKHIIKTSEFKTIDSTEELKAINGGGSFREMLNEIFGGKKDKDNNNG